MQSMHETLQFATAFYNAVGTPYAREAATKAIDGIYGISMPDPDAYHNHLDFAYDYACYTLLRKLKGTSQEDARLEAEAILGFEKTELDLLQTNRRIRDLPHLLKKPGVAGCINAAQRKIRQILGRFDPEEWFEGCEWGPGATATLAASEVSVDKKILETRVSVTQRALPFYRVFLEDPSTFSARTGQEVVGPFSVLPSEFCVVDSSRLTTVEKTVTERRVIDIQPTANLFLQKGIGLMIRRRLRRHGINLDDQSRNQWLASVAQRLQLATIDLSKASDTVCYELVRLLLPTEWFHALDLLRTTSTVYKGKKMYLQKFSAMGNGYTFELESLLFYALVLGVVERLGTDSLVGVYGDDIICSQAVSQQVCALLEHLGFTVNRTKTYVRGRFFESCGKHYFDGRDVTPLYQKEVLDDPVSIMRAANRLWRWALRMGGGFYLDKTAKPAHDFLIRLFKARYARWFRRGNDGAFPIQPWHLEGDFGLIGLRPHVFTPSRGSDAGFRCFIGLQISAVKRKGDEYALLALSLRRRCKTDSPFLGLVPIRGRTSRAVLSRFRVERLYELPAWY